MPPPPPILADGWSPKGGGAQSNELTRGPPPSEFSTFVYRGSSHRRKSAACPKFDMVWLYRSPLPVGRRGVISPFKWFLPALLHVKKERGSACPLWGGAYLDDIKKRGLFQYILFLFSQVGYDRRVRPFYGLQPVQVKDEKKNWGSRSEPKLGLSSLCIAMQKLNAIGQELIPPLVHWPPHYALQMQIGENSI